jgi:quinol monooxygenase YgiN
LFTATMHYRFRPEGFAAACEIWRRHVIEAAKAQPGFVQMQFLVAEPEAMAIGTWRDKSNAEDFMKTGVFVRLMAELEGLCATPPQPRVWNRLYHETAP